MARRSTHPDLTVEYLLQELERQGVDSAIIEAFASRAANRRRGQAANLRLSSGESSLPDNLSHMDHAPRLQTA